MKTKAVLNIIYTLIVGVVVVFGAIYAYLILRGPADYRFLVVQSGSMSPSIRAGSVVFAGQKIVGNGLVSPVPGPSYSPGEVVTFGSGDLFTTHRVVGVDEVDGEYIYSTKGDANKAADIRKVKEDEVFGNVLLTLPYLGYAVSFSQSQKGYVFLIVVPITVIVYSEILAIKREIGKWLGGRSKVSAV